MKYLLLVPQKGSDFGITNKEMIKAMKEEYNCGHVLSKDTQGNSVVYATANSIDDLERLTTNVCLEGQVVEMTGIWDMVID